MILKSTVIKSRVGKTEEKTTVSFDCSVFYWHISIYVLVFVSGPYARRLSNPYNNMGKGQRTYKCDEQHCHSTAKARLRCMRSRGIDPFKAKGKMKLGYKFKSIIRWTINSYRYICNIEKSPFFTHFFDQKQVKTLRVSWNAWFFISLFIPLLLQYKW